MGAAELGAAAVGGPRHAAVRLLLEAAPPADGHRACDGGRARGRPVTQLEPLHALRVLQSHRRAALGARSLVPFLKSLEEQLALGGGVLRVGVQGVAHALQLGGREAAGAVEREAVGGDVQSEVAVGAERLQPEPQRRRRRVADRERAQRRAAHHLVIKGDAALVGRDHSEGGDGRRRGAGAAGEDRGRQGRRSVRAAAHSEGLQLAKLGTAEAAGLGAAAVHAVTAHCWQPAPPGKANLPNLAAAAAAAAAVARAHLRARPRPQQSELIEERVERDVVAVDVVGDEFEDVLVVWVIQVGDGHLLAVVRVDAPRHKVEAQLMHLPRPDRDARLRRRKDLGADRDLDLGGEIREVAQDGHRRVVRLDVAVAQPID